MTSIRHRLLILLLGSWTTVWIAVAVIVLQSSGHEVAELLDAQLAQTAHVLSQFTGGVNLPSSESLESLASLPQFASPLEHPYENKISFQLWRGDQLVSAYGGAPPGPLADSMGFSDRDVGDTKWRVYGLASRQPDEMLFVAQSYAIRQELIQFLTIHALQPILWSLPLTVLLIWFSVTDGLRPLSRLAGAIGKRSAERLAPIDKTTVPAEIQPLTDALNRLMEQLDHALSEERRFASDASHELRTPLAVIRTHAQIAKRSKDPAERAEALDGLIAGVDRATHLCSQLLVLARLDPEAAESVHHAAPLADAVAQAVAENEALARSKSLAISRTLPEGDPCLVAMDPSALGILVANLLDNAIKYTPAGGRVGISVLPRGERVVLQIADSGPGIPAADRARVLERFYRRDSKSAPGAGLGLAIVQRISELYGAEIVFLDGDNGQGLLIEVAFQSPS